MEEILVFRPGQSTGQKEYRGMTQFYKLGEAKRALLSHTFQVILIHLDKEEKTGRKLAEYVREIPRYFLTPVLFFASDRRYEEWAFHRIHCYDYLIKPVSGETLLHIILPLTSAARAEQGAEQICFRCGKTVRATDICDIVYLMADNRFVRVHTIHDVFYVPYLCLSRFAGQHEEHFIQCHRAVVVNRSYVRGIDYTKGTVTVPGAVLDMGRSYYKYVRKEFDGKLSFSYNDAKE